MTPISDLSIDIVLTLEDWRNKPIKGEVYSIPGCQFIPNSSQCPIFLAHYCYEHLKSHLHPITANNGSLSHRNSSHGRKQMNKRK